MASRPTRTLAAAALLSAVAGATPEPVLAAGAAGACPDGDGVTVVVDFQELGGGTLVRCATGPQPTGLAALKNAGISVTGTTRWGEAFICRLEGKPGPDAEPCVDTPPASAYWSYWHASNGGTWTYSQLGVTARTPPPGSFEGWSFSLDRSATTAPPPRSTPLRPTPPERPTPPPAAPTGPAAGDPPPGQRPDPAPEQPERRSPTPGTPSADRSPPASSPADTTGPPASTAPPVPGSASATTDPAPPAERSAVEGSAASGGLPAGVAIGAGLLLALVAAAAVTARRRRASG